MPSVAPVSTVKRGVPLTLTTSEKVSRMSIMLPAPYEPSVVMAAMLLTVGAVVSMMRALLAPRDPALPGFGRVSVALLVATSLIVPVSAVVEK